MALAERLSQYNEIEKVRERPIIAYVTSSRPNAGGAMASDALPHILDQLLRVPKEHRKADLLIVSNGGDPAVAWRVMSVLRDRFEHIGALIPSAAFSAATMMALGADEIVMHPCGNLGPVDPQLAVKRSRGGAGEKEIVHFGSEDLGGFLQFVKDDVGLTDQEHLRSAFELFCSEAGALSIGVAARAAQLSVSMGEKLLRMHMKEDSQKAHGIAEALNKKFFHHGYPVGRREAKEIGLKVIEPDAALEELLWNLWLDLEKEMQCREPFSAMNLISQSPIAQQIFAPVAQVSIPSGLPQNVIDAITQQILAQTKLIGLEPVEYQVKNALIESPRMAAECVTIGKILAKREPDLKISLSNVQISSGWKPVAVPTLPSSSSP